VAEEEAGDGGNKLNIMNDTAQIVIKSSLKRKFARVLASGVFFFLCIVLIVTNIQETKQLHKQLDNPDSGMSTWRYDDVGNQVPANEFLFGEQKDELREALLLTIFFGCIFFFFLFQTRIVCVIDSEGISRSRFLGKQFYKKIVWKNIKNISITSQLVKTRYHTQKVEYLCISLKNDIETEKQSLLRQLMKYLNNKLLKSNNEWDVFIPLSGISSESVIEKIRPYMQENQLILS